MGRQKNRRPTERELGILRVLWERGPSTVREVNAVMNEDRATAYTTTLKFMQIMAEKGLVVRDESDRTHVYSAAVTQEQTQKELVGDLLDKVFGGSAEKLVMRALSAKQVSARQMAKIKKILDEVEGE